MTFNVPIIPIDTGHGQYPFPEIDGRGCVYTSIVPTSEWSTPPAIPANTCTNNVDRATADSELNVVLFSFLFVGDLNARSQIVVGSKISTRPNLPRPRSFRRRSSSGR